MNSTEFKALTIEDQVNYINEGESLSKVCKELKISKSISQKLKLKGYIVVNGKYTLTTPSNKPPQTQEVATDIISRPKVKSVKKPQETKKIGRPCKLVATTKLTLEVDKSLHKKLKVYCAENELKMNEYITRLLLDNLK